MFFKIEKKHVFSQFMIVLSILKNMFPAVFNFHDTFQCLFPAVFNFQCLSCIFKCINIFDKNILSTNAVVYLKHTLITSNYIHGFFFFFSFFKGIGTDTVQAEIPLRWETRRVRDDIGLYYTLYMLVVLVM
jgi:hypothetical protein